MQISFTLSRDDQRRARKFLAQMDRRQFGDPWWLKAYWFVVLPSVIVVFAIAFDSAPAAIAAFVVNFLLGRAYSWLYWSRYNKSLGRDSVGDASTVWNAEASETGYRLISHYVEHRYAWS